MLRLAVFLGNPGAEHERNRHNAGRLLCAGLPFYQSLSWTRKFRGLYASLPAEIAGRGICEDPPSGIIHFLVPETFMNLSGESVSAAAGFYKLGAAEIIAVHDELELDAGAVSLKFGGGLGGHNGLRSLKQHLGTGDFWRLRIGIGRPPGRAPGEGGPPVKGVHEGGDGAIASWVLSDFGRTEEAVFEAVLEATSNVLVKALVMGPESLLPVWGKKSVL
jgi:PTH1 family peptidyl-tRNA hydrolase